MRRINSGYCSPVLGCWRLGNGGQAVKIEGLGTFTPTIRADGRFDILFRADADLLRQLSDTTKFYAKILNKANIGKSAEELAALWNEENPEDRVE